MCFTFNKNNKQTKKPVNRFLQDDASTGIRSLQTSIEIKLCQSPWNGLYSNAPNFALHLNWKLLPKLWSFDKKLSNALANTGA